MKQGAGIVKLAPAHSLVDSLQGHFGTVKAAKEAAVAESWEHGCCLRQNPARK